MPKFYKVWMSVEEYDEETDQYRDIESIDAVGSLGYFDSLEEAETFVQSMALDAMPISKKKAEEIKR